MSLIGKIMFFSAISSVHSNNNVAPSVTLLDMLLVVSLLFIVIYFGLYRSAYDAMKKKINEEESGSHKSTIQAFVFRYLSRDKRIVMNLESKMYYLTEKSFILSPDGVAKFLLKNEIAKFVETATKEIARLKS